MLMAGFLFATAVVLAMLAGLSLGDAILMIAASAAAPVGIGQLGHQIWGYKFGWSEVQSVALCGVMAAGTFLEYLLVWQLFNS